LTDVEQKGLPYTKSPEIVDPLNVLATPTDIAKWTQEGLQADRVSQENAAIVTECNRWPLLIDPQL
jgi:dynein heavy chain